MSYDAILFKKGKFNNDLQVYKMEITLQKSNQLKALAILMMLGLHLFNRDYHGLFQPLLFIGKVPLSYYLSLFCDACVPVFCFVSGYGLYIKYQEDSNIYVKGNFKRIKKLYFNYWTVLFVFSLFLGLLFNKEGYPGDITKFLLNFLGLSSSYNGAWWFFFTYLLLVTFSGLLFRFINKSNVVVVFCIILFLYMLSFYYRVYEPDCFSFVTLNWFQMQLSLLGTSLLPFMVGALAFKLKWNTMVTNFFQQKRLNNKVVILLMFFLIVIHSIIPNFIIAPFLAIPFIFLFNQLKLPNWISYSLGYLAPHATNMWLIHMFFYMIFFNEFIYSATYVLPIFLLLLFCSMLSSVVIIQINKVVMKAIRLL
jgi:surface polysaccharide O-acyltransferase-like enzyme